MADEYARHVNNPDVRPAEQRGIAGWTDPVSVDS